MKETNAFPHEGEELRTITNHSKPEDLTLEPGSKAAKIQYHIDELKKIFVEDKNSEEGFVLAATLKVNGRLAGLHSSMGVPAVLFSCFNDLCTEMESLYKELMPDE